MNNINSNGNHGKFAPFLGHFDSLKRKKFHERLLEKLTAAGIRVVPGDGDQSAKIRNDKGEPAGALFSDHAKSGKGDYLYVDAEDDQYYADKLKKLGVPVNSIEEGKQPSKNYVYFDLRAAVDKLNSDDPDEEWDRLIDGMVEIFAEVGGYIDQSKLTGDVAG